MFRKKDENECLVNRKVCTVTEVDNLWQKPLTLLGTKWDYIAQPPLLQVWLHAKSNHESWTVVMGSISKSPHTCFSMLLSAATGFNGDNLKSDLKSRVVKMAEAHQPAMSEYPYPAALLFIHLIFVHEWKSAYIAFVIIRVCIYFTQNLWGAYYLLTYQLTTDKQLEKMKNFSCLTSSRKLETIMGSFSVGVEHRRVFRSTKGVCLPRERSLPLSEVTQRCFTEGCWREFEWILVFPCDNATSVRRGKWNDICISMWYYSAWFIRYTWNS